MKRLKDSKRIIAIILMAVLLFTVASVDVSAKWLNIPDCTCSHSGELAVSHTEACAEKVFYNDFCNNTAEDIFRKWALLPEDGREYILLYLSEKDEAKYTQLYSMVESAWNSKTVAYDAQDPGVSVYASEQAFPNGTTITTEELTVSEEQQAAVMQAVNNISSNITVHGFCGTNITFKDRQGAEVQPSQAVSMKLTLNQSDSLSSANKVIVLHEGEDGLEVVGNVPIYGENTQSVAVAASGFSNYFSVLVSVPDYGNSLAQLYNLNDGDRLGLTKATDFYAYITTPNGYCLTYDTELTSIEGHPVTETFNRLLVSAKTAEQCAALDESEKNKYLWHFTVDTRDEVIVKDSYKITNVATGNVIDLAYYDLGNNKALIVGGRNSGVPSSNWNQRWFINCIDDNGNKRFQFAASANTAFMLDYGSYNDGNGLIVLYESSSANNKFNIVLDSDAQNTISSLYQEEVKVNPVENVSVLNDFYAYIGFTKSNGNKCLITYDANQTADEISSEYLNEWKVKNRVIGKEISGSYTDGIDSKDLWHFQRETAAEFNRKNNTTNVLDSYRITNVATGLSLDLYDENVRDNQPIDLFADAGNAASQRWFVEYDSTSKKYRMKLALNQAYSVHAYAGFDTANDNVVLYESNSEDVNEIFDIILDTDRQVCKPYLSGSIPELTDFYAYIKYGDKLLTFDDTNNNRLVVAKATDEECKGKNNYLWHFTLDTASAVERSSGSSTYTPNRGFYKILNVGYNGVIDSASGAYVENNVLRKYDSNDTAAQRWYITFRNNKFIFSGSADTSAYFCARGDGSTSNSEVNITLKENNISEFDIILADSAEYNSGLMSSQLGDNDDYSVKEFESEELKVNLFDYDPIAFNNSETGTSFAFDGYQKYLSDIDSVSLADLHNYTDTQLVDNGDEFYAYISFNNILRTGLAAEERCITYDDTGDDTTANPNKGGLMVGHAPASVQGVKRYLWRFVRQKTGDNKNAYAIQNMGNGKWLALGTSFKDGKEDDAYYAKFITPLSDSEDCYWHIKYSVADGGKFQIVPTKKAEGYKLDTAEGKTGYGNSVNIFLNGTTEFSYFNITIARKAGDQIVNAGDHFYAYIGYRPEDKAYWVTHKLTDETDTSVNSVKFDRLCIGSGDNLDNAYLWEFIRDESDGCKNSYQIRNVALYHDSFRSYVDLHGGWTENGTYLKINFEQTTDGLVSAQRWYIKYNAASNRFYIVSARNSDCYFGLESDDSKAPTLTPEEGAYVSVSKNSYNSKQLFDLLIVNGQTGFGVSNEKYLSEADSYTEAQIITPSEHFYAYIGHRPENTPYWIMNSDASVVIGGTTIGSNYLWEFTREDSGSFKNSYSIKNVSTGKYIELTSGTAGDGNAVGLNTAAAEAKQRWYIQYHNQPVNDQTYGRFYLTSAVDMAYAIDVQDGGTSAGTIIQLYSKDDQPGNKNKMLDILIVTEQLAGEDGRMLSTLDTYNDTQTVTPANHFYANIRCADSGGKNYWLTHYENAQMIEYNNNGYQNVEDKTYHGFVIGKSDSTYLTSKDYLWEFIREESGTYKDAYRIVNAAQPWLCLEAKDGDVQASNLVSLNIQRTSDNDRRASQLWYIKYNAANKRFFIASANNQTICMDVTDAQYTENRQISLWGSAENIDRKMFDLRIVNNISAYGLSSKDRGSYGRFISDTIGNDTKDTSINYGDEFYAMIAHRGDGTVSNWVTYKNLEANVNSTTKNNTNKYDRLVTATSNELSLGLGNNYLWKFVREKSGTYKDSYKIVNVATGTCVDILKGDNDNKVGGGNVVYLNTVNETVTDTQRWYIDCKIIEGKRRIMLRSAVENTAYYFDLWGGENGKPVNIYGTNFENTNTFFDVYVLYNSSVTAVAKNIVNQSLSESGYPVITGSGVTGEELFDPSVNHAGKTTVATNAKMQFIYNKKTGYYEYKSTANHAQYDNKDTIKLYSDTLGNYNYSYYDVPITASNYLDSVGKTVNESKTDQIDLSFENGMVVGKIIDDDPHFSYKNLSIDASKICKIYARAYIDPRITSESFSIYFMRSTDNDEYSEQRRFKLNFSKADSNNGWYDFVIDTSDRSSWPNAARNWNGTITGLRIDPIWEGSTLSPAASTDNPYDFKLARLCLISGTENINLKEAVGLNADSGDALFDMLIKDTDSSGNPVNYIRGIVNGKDSGYSNSNPQFQIRNLNIQAEKVSGIAVKAKIPDSVKQNAFQIFFLTSEDEKVKGSYRGGQVFTAEYNSSQRDKDGFYYLYFDLSKNDKLNTRDTWKGTITRLRFDIVDFVAEGNDYTAYNRFPRNPTSTPGTKDDPLVVELHSVSLIGKGTADSAGAFLPLADIADSTVGQGSAFSKDSWAAELNNTSVTNTSASRAIVNGKPQTSDINMSRSEVIKSISPAGDFDENNTDRYNIKSYIKNSDGSLTVTMNNETGEHAGKGKDLFWDYSNINVNASDVKAIRIKAKIPQIIEKNTFEVFFANTEDISSGGYIYDGNALSAVYNKEQVGEDGYYELYININAHQNWYGTIERLRLDPVDFQDYNTTRNPQSCPPDLMITIKSIEFLGYNTTADEEQTSYDSLYFGMSMEHDFYLPAGGIDEKGQPIEFEYIGDDDLWVFIDNELVLDLGGCHTAQHGKISFFDGVAYINGSAGTPLPSKVLEPNANHTLKLFYLERSGSTSSMMIRFNLPIATSLSVANKITTTGKMNDDQKNVLKNAENSNSNKKPRSETTYKIKATQGESATALSTLYYTVNGKIWNVVLDENKEATFTLLSNETAYFNLPEGYSVKFEPVTDSNTVDRFIYENSKTVQSQDRPGSDEFKDVADKNSAQTLNANRYVAYSFTNTYAAERTSLTIENKTTGKVDENQTFIYHIKGDPSDNMTKHIDTEVVVSHNTTKTETIRTWKAADFDSNGYIDPRFYLNINEMFDGLRADDLKNITVNASGIPQDKSMQLFYKTDETTGIGNEEFQKRSQLQKSIGTQAQDFVFDFRGYPEWHGKLTMLRLDPMMVEGDFSINSVTFNFLNGSSKVFDTRTEAACEKYFYPESDTWENSDIEIGTKTEDVTTVGGRVTINDLPVGKYTVTEDDSWSWRNELETTAKQYKAEEYDTESENSTVKFTSLDVNEAKNSVDITLSKSAYNQLTFTNKLTYDKWLDGNSYKQNVFN